jgi:hypothetical protein
LIQGSYTMVRAAMQDLERTHSEKSSVQDSATAAAASATLKSPATQQAPIQATSASMATTSKSEQNLVSETKKATVDGPGKVELSQLRETATSLMSVKAVLHACNQGLQSCRLGLVDHSAVVLPIVILLLLFMIILVFAGMTMLHHGKGDKSEDVYFHPAPAGASYGADKLVNPPDTTGPVARYMSRESSSSMAQRPFANDRISTPGARAFHAQSPGNSLMPSDKSASLHLCQELVVPQASECSLLVPNMPAQVAYARDTTLVAVDDFNNTAVFRAALSAFRAETLETPQLDIGARCLTLSSASGQTLFAVAREKVPQRSLNICNNADKLYGVLETMEPGVAFCLSTVMGQKVNFKVDNRIGTVNATAEDGRLLAIVEPSKVPGDTSERRSVIIGPLVDAGLIVLCLLSIDWLRNSS